VEAVIEICDVGTTVRVPPLETRVRYLWVDNSPLILLPLLKRTGNIVPELVEKIRNTTFNRTCLKFSLESCSWIWIQCFWAVVSYCIAYASKSPDSKTAEISTVSHLLPRL
jgi:hypothetical protein